MLVFSAVCTAFWAGYLVGSFAEYRRHLLNRPAQPAQPEWRPAEPDADDDQIGPLTQGLIDAVEMGIPNTSSELPDVLKSLYRSALISNQVPAQDASNEVVHARQITIGDVVLASSNDNIAVLYPDVYVLSDQEVFDLTQAMHKRIAHNLTTRAFDHTVTQHETQQA